MEILINGLLIFGVRIIDVSLATLCTVLIVRGKRGIGAIIGFIDVFIWFLVVRHALTIENASIWIAIAYAGGYAVGSFVGSWVEEKLAIGNSSVTVITKGIRNDLVEIIRSSGFAVSVVECQGKEGKNLMLIIQLDRKRVDELNKLVKQVAPDSFITISDTRKIINGYFR
ncbi:MAG: DUF5698 domain-containing protein [Bacilli bacterium]|nr:DUF5698 domain-containing protein [Bacilli bacterium]MDD3305277.1 DUF5698 domain-containing protein [Bacilli bacterium]MDD4053567.1 DUF5698 domain-containing protein [Bacilli bacterium]MDD4411466.1 DUF5698 domain-containing protein [Bacilli bacterium]